MSKKYYAIKQGKDVKDKIVTTWSECEKYVKSVPAIYKGFDDLISAQNYLQNISEEDIKKRLNNMQQFAGNNKRARFIKKENKTLKEIYDLYENI